MLNAATVEHLRVMRFSGMADELEAQLQDPKTYMSLSFEDRVGLIVDAEWNRRQKNTLAKLIKQAAFSLPSACIEDIEYLPDRKLDKGQFLRFATCRYIQDNHHIILKGASGSGKTFLACALGKEACRHLHRSRYIRMPDMLEMFNLATETGKGITSVVTKLSNYHVLIIDEWLLDIPSEKEVKYLLEIFEKRYDTWPTIFCTQYKQTEWHPRLGGGVIADAIMDRIVHNSETINSGTTNMRELLATHSV